MSVMIDVTLGGARRIGPRRFVGRVAGQKPGALLSKSLWVQTSGFEPPA